MLKKQFEVKTNGESARRFDRTSVIINLKSEDKYKFRTKKEKFVKHENEKKDVRTIKSYRIKIIKNDKNLSHGLSLTVY